jgi:hypothetical protein
MSLFFFSDKVELPAEACPHPDLHLGRSCRHLAVKRFVENELASWSQGDRMSL